MKGIVARHDSHLHFCLYLLFSGHVEKIDWVVHSALTVFAGAEETGELMKEDDSDEEYEDGEEEA